MTPRLRKRAIYGWKLDSIWVKRHSGMTKMEEPMTTAHPSTKLTEEKYLAIERHAEEKSEYLGVKMSETFEHVNA